MAEESAAPSTSADKLQSMDVDGEAKKLLGLGQKNLVMGDIPAAVNAFQEAASLLGEKYGETANECAEAFFFYGKSLLELARMENGVLGNALEGVQVEEEEKDEKTEDAMVESADNIDEEEREELREQVYNAMGEKDESRRTAEESPVQTEVEFQLKNKDIEMEEIKDNEIEQVKEEKKEQIMSVEDLSLEEKEEQAIVHEKHGDNEMSSDGPLKDAAARDESPMVTEKDAGEEKPLVAEEAVEDIAVQKPVLDKKAAEETNLVSEETKGAAGEDIVENLPVEKEEKSVLEMEEAGKLVVPDAEKQGDKIENNLVLEELVKVSGEEVSKTELVTAVEKIEQQVENKEEKEGESVDHAEKIDTVEPVENVKEKELKELSASEDACISTPNETVPAGAIEQSHEVQTEEKAEVAAKSHDVQSEEKAEVAAKVEKEEEKDEDMGEGEETEGSEDDDKVEDDKENESTIEKESEEDEVGNLELAWDMLELAKVIYKRQDTKEAQLHAAQAHLKLGEVSIESENYLQAIEEFHSCLALQQKYLEAHDRLLAETHYHLGLAYHYNNQYDEAVQQFSKSVEVIDKRLVMLAERLKAKEEGSTDDEKEIEELKELLPEIREKIEDSKESQKSARVAELALKATLVGGSSSSFSQGTDSSLASAIPVRQAPDGASQCITDISHLVRKKRKPEEETQQGDNEAKKSKPEPAVNGGGDAAPSGNEVAEKMEEEIEERPHIGTVQSAV